MNTAFGMFLCVVGWMNINVSEQRDAPSNTKTIILVSNSVRTSRFHTTFKLVYSFPRFTNHRNNLVYFVSAIQETSVLLRTVWFITVLTKAHH